MSKKKVLVVGAGIGGLSAAARLAALGFEVEVLEKNEGPGGRCGRLEQQGYAFDLGPTVLLMPKVLEETFAAVGKRLGDCLELTRLNPNYRIHFRDGEKLTLSGDLAHLRGELERLEPGSYARFERFMQVAQVQHDTSLEHFVGRNFDGLSDYLMPANLRRLLEVRAHQRMYGLLSRFVRDERLRAALTFQTMYLGLSPYEAPAVYGLLPYTEIAVGIWFPKGGMYAIPRALEAVCLELGVKLRYRTPVERIQVRDGRAHGVRLADGAELEADAVLCNADLPWAYKHLLADAPVRPPKVEKLRYTSSGYMLYLGLRRQVPELFHHNVFLGRDYAGSFDAIFRRFEVPEDPSFYINVPARTDPSLAPPGRDGLYVLVPVPHQHPRLDWRYEGPKVRKKVFARLEEEGFSLEQDVVCERVFTPDDWATTFNLERGSAFGLALNFLQVGPFRPPNQDPRTPNLFFVGSSTQPGSGIPTVMLSAKLATERIVAQLGRPDFTREAA